MGAKFDTKPKQSPVQGATAEMTEEAMQALAGAGLASFGARPKDPMLDLLMETL